MQGANFNQSNSCAQCFDANFEQQDSCAQFFAQVLAFQQYRSIWSKITVAQCDLGPVSNKSTIADGVLHKFYLKQQIEVP